jgi:predicted dienelactone hydrolase
MASLSSFSRPVIQTSLATAVAALLSACASAPEITPEILSLRQAVQVPEATHQTQRFEWQDASRNRSVLTKLYWPLETAASDSARVPLMVFSHGIGGSREGYSYIGKYLAANGIASMHVQHEGSDRQVWFGNPFMMVSRLQAAAKESEAIARTGDVRFALDQLLTAPSIGARIDVQRIVAAGHSYGANTMLLIAGAQVVREGAQLNLADPRFKAAIIISAPPFYGEDNLQPILGNITLPSLHITATGDDIQIPGYYSDSKDRIKTYEAISSLKPTRKWLAVFKDGSHSMFTDRFGTGGLETNPRVKLATRELMLQFIQTTLDISKTVGQTTAASFDAWRDRHQQIVARSEAM